jgi:hypothetical protein
MKMLAGGFDILRDRFGSLKQTHVDNINRIVGVAEDNGLDYNQTAYVLATAWHETNATMLPVIEAYWLSEGWRKRNLRYYPYYGRGYVQLTWEGNYKKAGDILGFDFVNNPKLVQNPQYAAIILVIGSRDAWFTEYRLSDFINRRKKDYVGARKIINGTDDDDLIANYATIFEKALRSW